MTPPPPPSAPNPQLATLPVLSFTDDKVGETFLDLKSALPDTARGVVHRAIIHDLQNKCRGTASTLTRVKVGGGGRKPYPQKKTGRAREGELGLHSDPAKESCSVHSHRFPNWLRSRITSHIDIDGFKHNNILPAPVAAFILSTGMKLDMQNNEKTMNHVITSDWIQLDGLKHIYVSLYNAGTRLYQNKELHE